MAADTTTTQANEVMTFYESKFLARSKELLVHQEGLQKSTRPTNLGKSTIFNRYTALAIASTGLTEGTNPTEVALTSTQVTVTLVEYGNIIKISKLLNLTSIDKEGAEKADLLGQNMGETLDFLTRDALTSGATVNYAGAKTTLTDVASSNTMSATEIRKIRRTLVKNKAQKYKNQMYMGKIGPDAEFDIIGDSVWVNAHTYKDGDALYKGYLGNLYGIDFLLTTQAKSEASTVTVYSNIFHGENAAGCFDLEKDLPRLYVKTPNEHDTSNALDRFSIMGWGGSYVAKVLVAAWVLNWKSAVSA